MTNKSGFPIAAAIAAAIAVAMLIFLFTVPGNYLRDMTAKLRVMTHEAEQAAVLGDMDAGYGNGCGTLGRDNAGI